MALGVAFGLGMSLLLKHSYLHYYPSIESCLVALCAYTCYFFSNGLSMSGIVSLLFCGITLKHYAYHTMSRRTQRASKYIFSTLAQLSENFIFIYLGMALFTSAPVSEPVFSYVKPVFITITTVAVVFTRYAAVFPLSTAINFFFKHARGQRSEELPHSYQMMLFWAGLRGAVGVALAAGFKGPNAQMMRTTVLVVVVLTVLLFGGTTARMLEVLGIRTGVEDDEGASSDEDEGPPFFSGATPSSSAGYLGRSARGRGNWSRYWEDQEQESSALSPTTGHFNTPAAAAAARVGSHYASRFNNFNHHYQPRDSPSHAQIFSAASSDSYDSDGAEVLPLAPTAIHHETSRDTNNTSNSDPSDPSNHNNTHPSGRFSGFIGEDGRWFQNLDERYLLPLFSNATASRTFHARKSARKASGRGSNGGTSSPKPRDSVGRRSPGGRRSGMATPADSDDEFFGSREAVDLSINTSVGGAAGTSSNSGSANASFSGNGNGSDNGGARRVVLADESRTERGLASPTLRGSASSPWDDSR